MRNLNPKLGVVLERSWVYLTGMLMAGMIACSDGSDNGETGAEAPPLEDPRFDEVEAAGRAELEENLASGLSIAVMQAGEFVWVKSFGSASPLSDVPIGADTLFQIGSTTKQLTAMAVLTQVEQGLYSLDDTLAELLPRLSLASDPDWVEQATLRDLLSHRSGLADDIELVDTAEDSGLADFVYTQFTNESWVMNPPGLFWNYSNPNFGLSGLILEEHDPLGRSYPEIVQQELLEPLGMTRSFVRVSDAHAAGNYADSFGIAPEDVHFGRFPDVQLGEPRALAIDELADAAVDRPQGASNFSTPSDMCRWGHFLMHGNRAVIGDEARALLTTPVTPTQWVPTEYYGLGEFVWDAYPLSGDPFVPSEYYPLTVWEHGGNTLSFTSSLVVIPEHDVVVSMLSNGFSDSHSATLEAVLRAVLAPLPEPLPGDPHSVDSSRLPALAGRYFDPEVAGEIMISEGGANGLQISIPAFEERGFSVDPDLVPHSTYTWLSLVGDLTVDLTFIVDDRGELTPWLRARYFVARRSDEDASGPIVP
jgi:CubicO group peptidase (beta-lactamase class C family)